MREKVDENLVMQDNSLSQDKSMETFMDKKLLDILVCPICKGTLIYKKDLNELICRFDRLAYPIKNGIPVMLENEARSLNLEDLEKL